MDLIVALSIMTLGISIKCHYVDCRVLFFVRMSECSYAECLYAKCRFAECLGAVAYNCKQAWIRKRHIITNEKNNVSNMLTWSRLIF